MLVLGRDVAEVTSEGYVLLFVHDGRCVQSQDNSVGSA